MEVNIRAFGARIIGGFPHRFENSFFHLATERLRQESGQDISAAIDTLGGLPVPQALQHLPSRCLDWQPDIVVLQFGSSDLLVPVRKNRHLRQAGSPTGVAPHRAGLVHLLKWRARGLVGDLLQLKSVTLPEIYLDTMDQMIRTVAAHSAIPVVMSPFVLGSQRSDRIARRCVARLEKVAAAVPTAYYVEAYSALDKFPRREILLKDGKHLTIQGQVVVAELLFTVLGRVLRERETMFAENAKRENA
jgi:lysophospholipase L1-like esterase